jgi:predicted nucleotidyltransferase component of viral defense system
MLNLRSEDILHKSYLNRLLMEIIDRPSLSLNLAFKGGSCASMLGYLDRFSVDLGFDVLEGADEAQVRREFHQVFDDLGVTATKELSGGLFFQLRYPSSPGKRSTLKLSASNLLVKANLYKVQYLPEIDRLANCQTIETMFANKLVALMDRFETHRTIAGRDIYDIHHFFVHGYSYHAAVIRERTGLQAKEYFRKLIAFMQDRVTQTVINQDLNTLLPPDRFQQIRKILIPETLSLLAAELEKYP